MFRNSFFTSAFKSESLWYVCHWCIIWKVISVPVKPPLKTPEREKVFCSLCLFHVSLFDFLHLHITSNQVLVLSAVELSTHIQDTQAYFYKVLRRYDSNNKPWKKKQKSKRNMQSPFRFICLCVTGSILAVIHVGLLPLEVPHKHTSSWALWSTFNYVRIVNFIVEIGNVKGLCFAPNRDKQ